MEKNFEKFTPIKVEDDDLLEEINEIAKEKAGFEFIIKVVATRQGELHEKKQKWWDKAIAKYKIPKKYRYKLTYDHSVKEIQLR